MRQRKSSAVAAAPDVQPPAPHIIDPHSVYTIPSARAALGLRKECLPREIRAGRLEARKRGGRYYVLGKWLIRWLETGSTHPRWRSVERDTPRLRSQNGDQIDADGVAGPGAAEAG